MSSSTPDPDAASNRGASPPAALEVAGASHSYGKRKALENVSFRVAQGSFSFILGLNGAGKSTLF